MQPVRDSRGFNQATNCACPRFALWDARAVWSNPIKVGTAPVRNDAYNMLSIYFSAGVNNGDSFYFTVDTDSAQ